MNVMPQQEEFLLKDVVSILRRRLRLIFLVLFIILGGTFLYLARTTPLYQATTLILVDPGQKDLLDPAQVSLNAQIATSLIESEVEILRSDTVLLSLIEAQNLVQDPEFGPSLSMVGKIKAAIGLGGAVDESPEALLNQTLSKVREGVSVRRRGLTNLIALSFTSQDPKKAAELANALAATYIRSQVASKAASFNDARVVLESQVAAAQIRLAASDTALSDYIDQNLTRLAEESGSEQVAAIKAQIEALRVERLAAVDRADTAAGALASGDWTSLADQLGNQALDALNSQRQVLAARLAGVEQGSAAAVDLRAGLDRIEQQLATQGESALATLRAEVSGYDQSAADLRDTMRGALLSANLSPETLSQVYGLQQDSTIAQRQYDTLLNRMRDIETQALVQIADSRVASAALPPASAASPRVTMILGLAFVAALGIGVGAAFLSEYYVGGIHSPSQLSNVISARLGSVLPKVPQTADQITVADAIIDAPMSHFSESLRRLRASIDRFARKGAHGAQIIMVTSAIPAEGKSVTALSLARTYAAAGQRTLLIDGDMRKPTQHKLLGVEPVSGLFEYLMQTEDDPQAADCFDVDPRSRLGVIFGRQRSDAPTDQPIQSEAFRRLLEDARQSFDVIIIDTPPLIPVVDARYVAGLVDAAVLVCRTGETSQTDLRTAFETLRDHVDDGVAILTVLTFNATPEHDYKYSGYYY